MSNIERYQECIECGATFDSGNNCPECGHDESLRHYRTRGTDVLSVTTVLKWLEEDETGLNIWKRRNDGYGNSAHHEHLFWYKTYRGTLCHYNALSLFDKHHRGDMWGDNEQEALHEIMHGPSSGRFEDASHDNKDVVFSIMRDHGWVYSEQDFDARHMEWYCTQCGEVKDGKRNCPDCGAFMSKRLSTTIMDVHNVDVEWFVEAFERLCNELGVDDESIIAVEQFLIHDKYGYGGQTDMVYEDKSGNVVVVDLKTSSSLRHKHRLQAVAYAKAVEHSYEIGVEEVDRIEVWRIHPDTQTGTIHTNEMPEHQERTEWYTDEHWYEDEWGDFEYRDMDHMWETFKDLIKEANATDRNGVS